MVILVTGGRDYNDREFAFKKLNTVAGDRKDVRVVHGACGCNKVFDVNKLRGADALAEAWAYERDFQVMRVPADWGRGDWHAGPKRNSFMVYTVRFVVQDDEKVCVVFPGGRGTANCRNRARKNGLMIVD